MDFLTQYGMFLAKTVTILTGALLFIIAIAATKRQSKSRGKLTIKKLNQQIDQIMKTIHQAILSKDEMKQIHKLDKQNQKLTKKSKKSKPRIFVIDFKGDVKASALDALREEVTAICLTAVPNRDHVLCRLESPGGLVNAYGLAASQLRRFKEAGIKLTVAVDKIATSGGYMMACVADEIIAAPFAIVGSIGVVAQLPNFHRWLDKKLIDFEQFTAGDYKRTVTMFGENTNKDRAKMQEDVDDTHALFKSFITENRSKVDIHKVATGEYWYATRAFDLRLVDQIKTSDQYILSAKDDCDIYQLHYRIKRSLSERLGHQLSVLAHKTLRLTQATHHADQPKDIH